MSDDIFSEIPDTGYREQTESINYREYDKVLRSRRSVRVYTDEAIPEEAVQTILDSALLAPNSSNLQPWEFHWAKSEAAKKKVVEACMSQPAASTAAELIVCVARTKTWKKHTKMMLELFQKEADQVPASALQYYKKIVPMVYEQGPCSILFPLKWLMFNVRGLVSPTPREPVSQTDMKMWAIKSTALACENMMLTARALGYDSCPMEGYDSKRVRKILNLPSDAVPVMVISLGKRAENGVYGRQVRFDRDLFIKVH